MRLEPKKLSSPLHHPSNSNIGQKTSQKQSNERVFYAKISQVDIYL